MTDMIHVEVKAHHIQGANPRSPWDCYVARALKEQFPEVGSAGIVVAYDYFQLKDSVYRIPDHEAKLIGRAMESNGGWEPEPFSFDAPFLRKTGCFGSMSGLESLIAFRGSDDAPLSIADNGRFRSEIGEIVDRTRWATWDLGPVDCQRVREVLYAPFLVAPSLEVLEAWGGRPSNAGTAEAQAAMQPRRFTTRDGHVYLSHGFEIVDPASPRASDAPAPVEPESGKPEPAVAVEDWPTAPNRVNIPVTHAPEAPVREHPVRSWLVERAEAMP